MNINVNIERLVLDGLAVTYGQSARVRQEVETQLCNLLSRNGIAPRFLSGGSFAAIAGGGIQLKENVSTAGIGRQIASAVYRGLAY